MKVLLLFYWGLVDAGKAGRWVNWLRLNTFMPDAASNFGTDGGNIVNSCIASIPNIMCNTKVRRLGQSINRKTK